MRWRCESWSPAVSVVATTGGGGGRRGRQGDRAARGADRGGGQLREAEAVDRSAHRWRSRRCRSRWSRRRGGAEHGRRVVGRRRTDVVDFREDRLILLVRGGVLGAVQRAVRRFGGQRDRAVEQAVHLRERTVSDLQQADAVAGIGGRLGESRAVRRQAVSQGETSRVVRTGVERRTRRQLLQGVLQAFWVLFRLFSAYSAEILFRTPNDITLLLWLGYSPCVWFPGLQFRRPGSV